jgi:hypothetical protein
MVTIGSMELIKPNLIFIYNKFNVNFKSYINFGRTQMKENIKLK